MVMELGRPHSFEPEVKSKQQSKLELQDSRYIAGRVSEISSESRPAYSSAPYRR